VVTRFKNKTDYTVRSFSDLERLNNEQRVEVEHFKFFGESDKCTDSLRILLENCKAIHAHLEAVGERVTSPPVR
jgi:hypothetical protein